VVIGRVDLVGAGPGHPGLITEQAKKCLAEAEVVVYDRLLSPRLLTIAPSDAELIYVGKQATLHTMAQGEIERILVHHAQAGKRVVRLKGGDPFVFGRGSEEALALRAAGIPYEVVPGLSASISVPAYAGIPVTHRNLATSFTVVTGHESKDETEHHSALQAVRPGGTVVILMGLGRLPQIVEQLQARGFANSTPVAVVKSGTRAAQETLTGRLDTIALQVRAAKLTSPAIIVVGEVVTLQGAVGWADERPLFGKRILVTAQTKENAVEMADALEALGAETYNFSVEHHSDVHPEALGQVCTEIADRHRPYAIWFRTALAVKTFFEGRFALQLDMRVLANVYFGAANDLVAETLATYGVYADALGCPSRQPNVYRTFVESSWSVANDVQDGLDEWRDVDADTVYFAFTRTHVRRRLLEALERDWGTKPIDAVWTDVPASFVAFQNAASDTFMHGVTQAARFVRSETRLLRDVQNLYAARAVNAAQVSDLLQRAETLTVVAGAMTR